MMNRVLVISLSLICVWLIFYFGLFLGIQYGLRSALYTERKGLEELNAIIKIRDKKTTNEGKASILEEHNRAIRSYILQREKVIEQFSYFDVLMEPYESILMLKRGI